MITTKTADLAVGVAFKNVGTALSTGAAVVIYGSFVINGLTASGSQIWTQSSLGVPGTPESGNDFGAARY